jgi:CRP/FNR family transcriptional regulator, anaerobic regulatory protein
MDVLKNFITKYVALTEIEWLTIQDSFEKICLAKNELVLEEGKVCKYLYFAESGLLRFFINKEGKEITKFFTKSPYFFTSQVSFNYEKPATENIQAIEKGLVWRISYAQNKELLKLKGWSEFATKITQEVQFFTEEILEGLQTETAESRYEKMVKSNPALLNRIPLQYLASFLGIAPQSLSRIRKKIIPT